MAVKKNATRDLVEWEELYRDLRNDYDAGKPGRFNRRRPGVSGNGRSADYHYASEYAYFYAMEWARDVDRNDVVVGQGIDRAVANIVQDGFTLDAETGDDAVDEALEARWNAEAYDADTWDLAGEMTFRAMEELTLRAQIVDGDICHIPEPETGLIESVEAHRLRTPRSTTQNVVHGVLLSDVRRRLEYWFTLDDISPMSAVAKVSDVRRYKAREWDQLTRRYERAVIHVYNPKRVSQTRGLTALAPILNTAEQHDDSQFAELIARKMQACVAILEERPLQGPPGVAFPSTGSTQAGDSERFTFELSPGARLRSSPGGKLVGFNPTIPGAQYKPHSLMLLTFISVNLGLPLQLLLLDPTQTNFSGWRGAMDQARLGFRAIQTRLIERFHTPIYRARVRHWLQRDPALRLALAKGVDVFAHRWASPRWPYIQPEVDAQTGATRVKTFQTSPQRLAQENGLEEHEIAAECAKAAGKRLRLFIGEAMSINEELPGNPKPVVWTDLVSILSLGNYNPNFSGAAPAAPTDTPEPPDDANPETEEPAPDVPDSEDEPEEEAADDE